MISLKFIDVVFSDVVLVPRVSTVRCRAGQEVCFDLKGSDRKLFVADIVYKQGGKTLQLQPDVGVRLGSTGSPQVGLSCGSVFSSGSEEAAPVFHVTLRQHS